MAKKNYSKKHPLRIFIYFLVIIGIVAAYWYFENYTFGVNRVTVDLEKVEEPFTIVQICDLHGIEFDKGNDRLATKINNLEPDLVFVTGDMYTSTEKSGIDVAVELLRKIKAPTYFVMGEHDRDKEYIRKLEDIDVTVLEDDYEILNINGNTVNVMGICDAFFSGELNLESRFPKLKNDRVNLLLAHIPQLDLYTGFGADITFSGDTHGGIMQIPIVGPVNYDDTWFPEIRFKNMITDKGLFEKNGKHLFVSSGLGAYPYPLRFNNRPEIVCMTVK